MLLRPVLDWNPPLWLEFRSGAGSRRTRAIWLLYGAITVGLTALVFYENSLSRGWAKINDIELINSIQISLGLLLVSIPAAAGLAEDRVNGTLAALLATPLTTRSIILGKWLGAYQTVPWLAIFPCLVLSYIAGVSAGPVEILLVFGLVLAYGAAVVSLGLYLATTIPNVGRAVAATMATYVLLCAGVALVLNFSSSLVDTAFGLLMELASLGLLTGWGFHLVGAVWKGDRGSALHLTAFVSTFVVAAILLPPIATVCDIFEPRSSAWIATIAFFGPLIGGFLVRKRTACFSEEIARELGLYVLFCACLLPVLIGCGLGWSTGVRLVSPWLAGRVMVLEVLGGYSTSGHVPWALFWILTFGASAAFLLRATQKALDYYFERIPHR
jgi:ABC-type transport system involved in multi-copper enzyme maturation permease subunit